MGAFCDSLVLHEHWAGRALAYLMADQLIRSLSESQLPSLRRGSAADAMQFLNSRRAADFKSSITELHRMKPCSCCFAAHLSYAKWHML